MTVPNNRMEHDVGKGVPTRRYRSDSSVAFNREDAIENNEKVAMQ